MTAHPSLASWRAFVAVLMASAIALGACGSDGDANAGDAAEASEASAPAALRIGAIPDQEPERLQRTYGLLAEYLESSLGVPVEYTPVTDYQGAVSAFRVGDLDAVWFGGLTGVQARLEVDGAQAFAQRDIDEVFTSVFIAGADVDLAEITDVAGLAALDGRSLSFGSESSTSGRLMPESFLNEAGLAIDESFGGAVGFSGSHDATIEVVAAGTYEIGALNSQVWDKRVEEGSVDPSRVVEIFRTPTYFDYHWVAQPDLDERFGNGFVDDFTGALTSLDEADESHAEILGLFGAGAFIPSSNDKYASIETVGRNAGLIR